ncbi:hypothetical protein [Leptospira paudalimensis]|uniref:Uncharacterized protein n=1 Tax=Leptospira paudalimensis TaxID=2950024 RepID=A0ABT3MCJ0_9LEPT|nr:hypothetical protein [Leptospira paudalimensis]MCW7506105.1 hypothetical protein [Leptospira paudalimensis]
MENKNNEDDMEMDWEEAWRLDNEMKATEYYKRIQEARKQRVPKEQTEDSPNPGEN